MVGVEMAEGSATSSVECGRVRGMAEIQGERALIQEHCRGSESRLSRCIVDNNISNAPFFQYPRIPCPPSCPRDPESSLKVVDPTTRGAKSLRCSSVAIAGKVSLPLHVYSGSVQYHYKHITVSHTPAAINSKQIPDLRSQEC